MLRANISISTLNINRIRDVVHLLYVGNYGSKKLWERIILLCEYGQFKFLYTYIASVTPYNVAVNLSVNNVGSLLFYIHAIDKEHWLFVNINVVFFWFLR